MTANQFYRILFFVILSLLIFSCRKGEASPGLPQVRYTNPESRIVTVYDSYPGTVQSAQVAEIRSRVSGYVKEQHFVDGSYVEKDSLLFSVDPRAAQANTEVREAQVTAAESELTYAKNNLNRASKLLEIGAISKEEYESRKRLFKVADSNLKAANERQESSNSDLDYAIIKAPFAGRVSDSNVDKGDLTTPEKLLTTISTQDPIYVVFEIDEASVLKYRKELAGFNDLLRGHKPKEEIKIEFDPGDGSGFSITGVLDFVDNSLDRSSGTLKARASVPNPEFILQPNFFVSVRIPITADTPSLLLPRTAVLSQQNSRSVLLVEEEELVATRAVTLGEQVGVDVQIIDGLKENDRVIVDNLSRLFPGQKVVAQKVGDEAPNQKASQEE